VAWGEGNAWDITLSNFGVSCGMGKKTLQGKIETALFVEEMTLEHYTLLF